MNKRLKTVIIISIALFTIGIGQLIFVFSARSSLIWAHSPTNLNYSEIVHLPKNILNPRKYLFVFSARHGYMGSYSGGNVTLRHLSTGQEFDLHFALSSSIYEAVPDSHLLDIPSGKYEISVISYPNVLYDIKLYMNGIFNSKGDPTLFPETTALITSIVIMVVLVIVCISLIADYIKKLMKSKFELNDTIK